MLVSYFNFESSILIIKRILTFSSERGYEIAFYTNFMCGHFFSIHVRGRVEEGGRVWGGGGGVGGGGSQKKTKKKTVN